MLLKIEGTPFLFIVSYDSSLYIVSCSQMTSESKNNFESESPISKLLNSWWNLIKNLTQTKKTQIFLYDFESWKRWKRDTNYVHCCKYEI